jgi:hypothetical protein
MSKFIPLLGSWDNITGIVTRLWAVRYGVWNLAGVKRSLGAQLVSYTIGAMGSFPEVKQPRHESDHSPPPSDMVRNEWTHISIPLHGFMACTGATLPVPSPSTMLNVVHLHSHLFSREKIKVCINNTNVHFWYTDHHHHYISWYIWPKWYYTPTNSFFNYLMKPNQRETDIMTLTVTTLYNVTDRWVNETAALVQ